MNTIEFAYARGDVPASSGKVRLRNARLLTVREAARVLAVSTPIVYRLCERGTLANARVGNSIRIAPDALYDYVANATQRARTSAKR